MTPKSRLAFRENQNRSARSIQGLRGPNGSSAPNERPPLSPKRAFLTEHHLRNNNFSRCAQHDCQAVAQIDRADLRSGSTHAAPVNASEFRLSIRPAAANRNSSSSDLGFFRTSVRLPPAMSQSHRAAGWGICSTCIRPSWPR